MISLAAIVGRLELNEPQFNGLVSVTRSIVGHPFIKRLQDAISTPLSIGMTLKRPMLKVMYEVTEREWVEEHRERTPEERAHAAEVERQRKWMRDALTARAQHARSQELRRRCDEIAREFEHTRSLP